MTVIIDRTGMTPENTDHLLVKEILSTFQPHFPDRVARAIVFPRNYMLTIGWNLAKIFLDQPTIDKVKMLKEEDVLPCLHEHISLENLFKRYGGTVDDPYDLMEDEEFAKTKRQLDALMLPQERHLVDSGYVKKHQENNSVDNLNNRVYNNDEGNDDDDDDEDLKWEEAEEVMENSDLYLLAQESTELGGSKSTIFVSTEEISKTTDTLYDMSIRK